MLSDGTTSVADPLVRSSGSRCSRWHRENHLDEMCEQGNVLEKTQMCQPAAGKRIKTLQAPSFRSEKVSNAVWISLSGKL